MKQPVEKIEAQKLLVNKQAEKASLLMSDYCNKNPNDAEAFYILGQSFALQEDYQSAKLAFQKSIKIFPNMSWTHLALGGAFQALGEFEAAINKFKEASILDKTNYNAELSIVNILISQGKQQEARLLLTRLQKLIPDNCNVYIEWSRIERERYNIDKAIRYLEKALQLNPNAISALTQLASIYTAQAKLGEAEELYSKADKILPKNPEILSGFASLYSYQGNYKKAIEIITPLLKSKIINFEIAKVYIRVCKHIDKSDIAIQYVLKVLDSLNLAKTNKAYLYYELGREYDRLNKHDEAFANYKKANDTSKYLYDENKNKRKVTELIEVFSKDKIKKYFKSNLNDKRPVFIIGMPRSGTSLTEQILASHPDVFAGGELQFIGRMAFDLSNFKKSYPYSVEDINQNKINKLADQYLEHISSLSKTAMRITNKMPRDFYDLGLISMLFPNAYIIHCQRDAMDNCLSIYFQNFAEGGNEYSNDLKMIANYYKQYQRLMSHWVDTLNMPMLSLHYEETVSDQENQTRRLLEFCDLDWNKECLNFHELKRTIATASFDQVRQPLYTKSVNRWKHYENYIDDLKSILKN